jgi:5'-nucleotidase
LFGSEADAKFMTEVCFDAFTPGNHEFDDGDKVLADFLGQLKSTACTVPPLAANIVPHSASALLTATNPLKASKVFTMNGVKVGVVGINVKDKTMMSSRPDKGTVLTDELTAAQKEIDALTTAGVTHIILLTHVGIKMDVILGAGLTGVDVIIGGDSHTLLGDEGMTVKGLGFPTYDDYNYPVDMKDKVLTLQTQIILSRIIYS